MEWVEVTGKTVEEAKDKALDLLGVDDTQAEFEILEEPRIGGLFRRLKGEARVRARIKPVRPRPKAERRDRRRGRGSGEGSPARSEGRGEGRGDGRSEGRGEGRGEGRSSGGGRNRSARGNGRGPRSDRESVSDTTPSAEPSTSHASHVRERTSEDVSDLRTGDEIEHRENRPATPDEGEASRTGRSREGELQVQDELDTNETEPANERPEDGGDHHADREDTQGEDAKAFVEGLVGAFGMEADVSVQRIDDYLDEVQVTGSDLGILIGPKAATLEAVQELTRVAVQRRLDGRSDLRLRVDIGAYRQRRREALERFARKLAEEVRETGVQKVLEPMGSADRKVIHDTVGQLDGVRTLSEGEDPRRRVVIVPAG